ncbi:transketolase-like TK C-terminal-containing protein, partial [Vogesella mureinivorans]|uniref:transketolase-like TK C-terminal-containing protein n=1 Tax=Vogesella mureinivorans TaxID=657276 RepID=UPI003F6C22C9
ITRCFIKADIRTAFRAYSINIKNVAKGGYVLAEEKGELKAIIIATGSEVSLAMEAHAQLEGVRVVSMPCAEEFVKQDAAYREA